ncbi:MAG: methionyl-tRNA formyltransferase [Bacilli bacterium]
MTKILFMGTPDFAVGMLETLIEEGYNVIGAVTQPDKPVGRKRVLTPSPVKVCAEKHGIPVYQPTRIRLEEQYTDIIALGADLIVTAAYGQILPKALLEAPTLGCINVHGSILPELRGGAPIHYAIMQGKKETGITIMYMVEQLDAGDMLTKRTVEITQSDTVGSLYTKLTVCGQALLKDTLPPLIRGELIAEPQNDEEATFAPTIKREDEQLQWTRSQSALYDHVRGMNPWPVAFTTHEGNVVKVWAAVKVDGNIDAAPGTVIALDERGVVVACGDGQLLAITEWQWAGKKRMDVQASRNGGAFANFVGTKFQ